MTTTPGAPARPRRRPAAAAGLLVFVVAVLARLAVALVSTGGFHGLYDYDPSVYYTAADALTHGLAPYRDFAFVHPPVIAFVLTPFALLGRLTSADTGFVAGNLAFTLLGAVNAVLVVRVSLRSGLDVRAATVGGLFYAVWSGSVLAEFTVRLEPLGNFFFLCGLLALAIARTGDGRRAAVLGGVALGLAANVKIWWALPIVVVVVGFAVATRSARRAVPVVLGAAAVVLVVDGSFLALSHGRMWTMVVRTQLGRLRVNGGVAHRLSTLVSGSALPHAHALIPVLGIVVVVAAVAAVRVPAARVFVALLAVQVVVILAGPSDYQFYADYVTVAGSLVLAGTTTALGDRRWSGLAVGAVPVALAAALTAGQLMDSGATYVAPFPRARLTAAAAHFRCVTSDSPMGLILVDALDRSLEKPCSNWVDLSAHALGAIDPADRIVEGQPNLHWTADLRRYLNTADATLLVTHYRSNARSAMTGNPLVADVQGYDLFRDVVGRRPVR